MFKKKDHPGIGTQIVGHYRNAKFLFSPEWVSPLKYFWLFIEITILQSKNCLKQPVYTVDSWTTYIWPTQVHLHTDFFFFSLNIVLQIPFWTVTSLTWFGQDKTILKTIMHHSIFFSPGPTNTILFCTSIYSKHQKVGSPLAKINK